MLKKISGFTLIEMAVVLVIAGLLLAGGMNLMSASSDTAKYKQTQNELQDIKEALIGFYSSRRFLPCPDTDNPPDGFGNYADGTGSGSQSVNFSSASGTTSVACASPLRGWLPFNDIGVGGSGDAWGERIKYLVNTTAFTTPAVTSFCSDYVRGTNTTQITIQDLQLTPTTLGDWAAFVLVSTGKNGRQTNSGMTGAFSNNGGCSGLNVREQENCDADAVLRSGNSMFDGSSISFDDLIVWVGDYQLISSLRKSGLCTTAGNNNQGTGTGPGTGTSGSATNPTSRTSTTFTADPGKTFSNYNNNDTIATSAADDKVVINQNMNKDLNLQDGNNTLDIGQNSNAAVTSGSGNDTVRIQSNLNQPVNLGAGNDYLEVWGTSNSTIDMGPGNDSVRIEGGMNQNVSLGSGTNAIYIGGAVNADITAVGGTAIVYLNNYATLASVPAQLKNDAALTLMCKSGASFVVCS